MVGWAMKPVSLVQKVTDVLLVDVISGARLWPSVRDTYRNKPIGREQVAGQKVNWTLEGYDAMSSLGSAFPSR